MLLFSKNLPGNSPFNARLYFIFRIIAVQAWHHLFRLLKSKFFNIDFGSHPDSRIVTSIEYGYIAIKP
ncbi:hypothetical protein C5Y96_14360 [Blastopirellula marina]|uniref:Uncharacterized protein n=1 Tax=Blastopirellula marina TaxID=124 RepID=A0A2S8FES7_9BACT|nr:hypothetical protein C5Y96_14360 [Blastopirellula marina]RCS50784.1 hypothetical protein DTL36_14370 [Bremerella cremea]